jgi:GNAT superfamily N-acetyltransferase
MNFLLPWRDESVRVIVHSEEPDLTSRFDQLFPSVWPEFNMHGDVLHPRWEQLYEDFPGYQFVLVNDRTNTLLARGNTLPFFWDGDPDHLPEGIDATVEQGFADHASGQPPTTLSAMAAEVAPENRSKGLGSLLLKAMTVLATENGLSTLVAPVRPNRKYRYPLTPIEEYVHWKRPDGLPFDPWMRLHVLLGAKILKPAPRSLKISGTVAEWEAWSGMVFPASGTYVIPDGLATLEIDREQDIGCYWEPNVWMQHPIGDPLP